jgi:hypothetical protein
MIPSSVMSAPTTHFHMNLQLLQLEQEYPPAPLAGTLENVDMHI